MKTCACGGEIFKKSLAVEICSVDDEGDADELIESVPTWSDTPDYPHYSCCKCGAKWETWDDIPDATTKENDAD